MVRCSRSPRFLVLLALCGGVAWIGFLELQRWRTRGLPKCEPSQGDNLLSAYQSYIANHEVESNVSVARLNWVPVRRLISPTPNFCHKKVAIIVHSSPDSFEERECFRNQIFSIQNYSAEFGYFFVIGQSLAPEVNGRIHNETQVFGDVLLLDLHEHYHNMTHKARAWIEFLFVACRFHAPQFILKLDDDVSVDLMTTLHTLRLFAGFKTLVLGRVFPNGVVNRNPDSKWYLSRDEFPGLSLGVYCQGMAYAFSYDLLPRMFQNLHRTPFLWMDDWYVTHGLLAGTNAILLDLHSHFVSVDSEAQLHALMASDTSSRGVQKRLLFGHFRPKHDFPPTRRRRLWLRLQRLRSCV